MEELEDNVRNSQLKDENNRQALYAIEIIEDFKTLDLSSNNSRSIK